jgi:mycofactocin radical SAM maturase
MLIDNALAERLSKLEMLYLQVSLDGATAEANDVIRGKGTYKKIVDAMSCLTRHSVPFSINTVLTCLNFLHLEDLMRLAKAYKCDLRVSRFRPSGRGKESRRWLTPDRDQLETFAEWLKEHDAVRTGDSFFCLTSEHRRKKGLDMCGAAKMTCCISPIGHVYPCAFLQESPFLAGNIRERAFKDLWDHSPVFHLFRNLQVRSCLGCYRFEDCRGGCPAVAFHTYHDFSLPDPECLANLKKSAEAGDSVKYARPIDYV